MSTAAERVARVLLLGAGVVLGALSVECAVRVWSWVAPLSLFELDAQLGWIHRPDTRRVEHLEGNRAIVSTNALGARGPFHVDPSRKHRILIVGDSIAEGRQVFDEDLFSARIERVEPGLELVNVGVMGYSTVQETLLLERLAPVVRPELVVVMVFRNDLDDNVTPFSPFVGPRPYVDASGVLHAPEWAPFIAFLGPLPGGAWLYPRSMAIQLWHTRRAPETLSRWRRLNAFKDYARRVPLAVRWQIFDEWVGRMAANRRVLMVGCPTLQSVRRGNARFTQRVGAVAASHGLPYLNLQDGLAAEDYLEIHWSPRGHRTVALRLGPVLRDLVTSPEHRGEGARRRPVLTLLGGAS